jgi:hypothetical protein
MRKLGSKKQEAKKKQRNQIIIGAILVVVMFGSVFGLVTMNFNNPENNGNQVTYNGYDFTNQGPYWYLTIGGKDYFFQYNPFQIQESFNLTTENLKYLSAYSGAPLYINSQENVNAESEIGRTFSGVSLRTQKACLDNNGTTLENCDVNLPLKDCSNNFIIVRTSEDNENKIYQDKNCVFIEGPSENLIKLTDDYLFKIMGIK